MRRHPLSMTALPLLLLVLTLLGGCTGLRWLGLLPPKPLNPLTHVQLLADSDANQNTATAIDLLWVFDSTALAALPQSGPQWFANRAALQANLGARLAVVSVELPPGAALQSLPLPANHGRAVVALAFVNHLSAPGQVVGRFSDHRCARIVVAAQSVRYAACPAEVSPISPPPGSPT